MGKTFQKGKNKQLSTIPTMMKDLNKSLRRVTNNNYNIRGFYSLAILCMKQSLFHASHMNFTNSVSRYPKSWNLRMFSQWFQCYADTDINKGQTKLVRLSLPTE